MDTTGIKTIRYIVAAVVAIITVTLTLWIYNTLHKNKQEESVTTNKLTESDKMLQNCILLQQQFNVIQQLDENYSMALTGSGSRSEVLDAANKIGKAESGFFVTLDSIQKITDKYNALSNVMLMDSLTSTMRLAIINRNFYTSLRNSYNGNSSLNPSQKQVMQLQHDLQKKDQRIAMLEQKPPLVKYVNAEPEDLEKSLNEEEMRNTALLDITNNLKQENVKLKADLKKLRVPIAGEEDATMITRSNYESLEKEVEDLGAELHFAQIDCNLTRADANKIISNSRQRKELLAGALQALKNLSQSERPAVQRKAMEKLNELNQIASTVRD